MTEERFRDIEIRMRKVEDFILSQLNTLLELSQSLKSRVEVLEEHDVEFMAIVHSTCDVKNKEISKAREESIAISTAHADSNHKQTWAVIGVMFSMFIGAVLYFNNANTDRAIASQKNATNIEAITHALDKIDSKLDKLSERMEDNK